MSKIRPKYPVYIPSKGRYDECYTADLMIENDMDFRIVIEQQEYDQYAAKYGEDRLLVLPFSNRGSVIPARNWMKQHSIEEGHAKHWQIDDNITTFQRRYRGRKPHVDGNIALRVTEDFCDRYENVPIAGLNYESFVPIWTKFPPFYLNSRVYSCTLVDNSFPYKWRGRYNEDTDMCLQVLTDGHCTILMNAFCVHKLRTMTVKGGNTDELYGGDGRLEMARSLQRRWPHIVKVRRRFKRPQHIVDWTIFDNKLKRKKGIDIPEGINEYGMQLKQVRDEVHSEKLQEFLEDYK